MKENKSKKRKTPSTQTQRPAPHNPWHPFPPNPAAQLYHVVIDVDRHAVAHLLCRPLRIRRFALGLKDGKVALEATASFQELFIIGDWLYTMGSHATLRSPSFLKDVFEPLLPAEPAPAEHSFPA